MNLEEMIKPLLCWFTKNIRDLPWRDNATPYHVWVSEIMLQQTRVETVKPYYTRFIKTLPTISDLAACEEEPLLKLWEGLGYYSRVRNMQKAARQIVNDYDGKLPMDYDALLRLSGIGEYTAGAIASIAFGVPVPAVDGNVLRVMSRVTGSDKNITLTATKKEITATLQVIMPTDHPGDFNEALMELGATVCMPNAKPKCAVCPLAHLCTAFMLDLTTELPVKTKLKPRKKEEYTVFLFTCESHIALEKRGENRVLAGMWGLPAVQGHLTMAQIMALLETLHITAKRISQPKVYKHIFTHIEWHMQGYVITCEKSALDTASAFTWTADRDSVTIPTAFRFLLP